MQTQTIQGPILGLVQKWTILRRCLRCNHLILVVCSSDGTYFGAHRSYLHAQRPLNKSLWICDKCFGVKETADKPAKKKGKMGFATK